MYLVICFYGLLSGNGHDCFLLHPNQFSQNTILPLDVVEKTPLKTKENKYPRKIPIYCTFRAHKNTFRRRPHLDHRLPKGFFQHILKLKFRTRFCSPIFITDTNNFNLTEVVSLSQGSIPATAQPQVI